MRCVPGNDHYIQYKIHDHDDHDDHYDHDRAGFDGLL